MLCYWYSPRRVFDVAFTCTLNYVPGERPGNQKSKSKVNECETQQDSANCKELTMTLAPSADNADGLPHLERRLRAGHHRGWAEHARVCPQRLCRRRRRRRRREVPALPPSPSPVARPLASSTG